MIQIKYCRVIIVTGFLFLLSPPAFTYEPTFNEIVIKKERLETFCKQVDNQRKFDICEKFKSLKGKLPDQVGDFDLFKQIHNQPAKKTSP
ncbi:MAG: hypothetical protein HQ517_15045 [SAR324 cluster bacterium]|nr:hypothetical protein [SAR324 cluster bacterium]